jgi:hypothetical protein
MAASGTLLTLIPSGRIFVTHNPISVTDGSLIALNEVTA